MDKQFKESIWKQFGASIDMLENAITMCPDELWDTDKNFLVLGLSLFVLVRFLSYA